LKVNVKGAFITSQAFMPTKGKNPIIVCTSTAAVALPAAMVTNGSSYAASKLGLIKFMEILAAEHPDVHITTIHPGVIETDMFEKSGMTEMPLDKGRCPSPHLERNLC
jgi:NAD(P)-dependent dehydrogenase (short-subunit alcohol dehydrogenase family)